MTLDAIIEAVGREPYFRDESVCIYHADARDILPLIPSVDLVLTDPPYGIGFDYGKNGHKDSREGYIEWLWPIIQEAEQKLRGGYCALFQSSKTARAWAGWFPRDWRLVSIPKRFVQLTKTLDIQWATDYVLFWTTCELQERWKEREYFARDWYLSEATLIKRDALTAQHPCPRPLDTMRYMVSCFSFPKQTILDPFM